MRVDEEKCDNLAVARLRRISELKRLYLVLVDIREGDAAALCCGNGTQVLHERQLPAKK